jgi:hypothetical protein
MEEQKYPQNIGIAASSPMGNIPVRRTPSAVGFSDRGEISGEEPTYADNTVSNNKSLRKIEIEPISSGFLVNVGCQRIAIETPDKLIYMLTKYLTDPTKFESEWYSKDVINKLDNIK